MALAAAAFLMRSCDVPADTFRSDSASAIKPTVEGRSWLLWKQAGGGGTSQVWPYLGSPGSSAICLGLLDGCLS